MRLALIKHWLLWSVLPFSKWNCAIIQPNYHFPLQKVRTEKDHGICILLQFGKICQWKIAPTHMRPIFVKKKPRLSLFVKKKKFKFTENEIFEIFMKGNWKSMSGSISIQSCSSNIISKSHNLARKTRLESFSIFWCSCCL